MANRYSVGGRSAATAATADHVAAALWNPHGSLSLYVHEVMIFKTVATVDNHGLIRTSTRGTAGSTVTPDADNAYNRRATPPSGALLDLAAYSAQPTLQGPYMARSNLAAAIGAGFILVFGDQGIEVPFGTGLAIVTPPAVILQPSDFTFVWTE